MKIGQKLTLSYVVIAILATITVVVAFASYRNIMSAFVQLERDPIPTAKALEDLRKYTVQIITSTSKIGYIYSETANGTKFQDKDISNEQRELDKAYADFDKALIRYENLVTASDYHNVQLFNDIELHGARVKEISGEFVLLKKNGGKGQAVLDLRDALETQEGAFLEATDTSLAAEYAEMQNQQQNVVATISASQLTSGLVTFFVFAFATWSGLLISRSISKRLSALKDAAEKIGSGKFDTRVDITSKDELGDLGHSFNNMVGDLRFASSNLDVATKRLQESEERWQLALHVNDDGIWDWDIRNKRYFYSPRWRKMFGYDETEAIDESPANIEQFFHPDDRPLALALRNQLREGGTPYFDEEFRHHCKDGSYKWVRCRGQALLDPETGRVERVIGLDTDIELKKRAELEHEAIATILQGVSETSNLDELLALIHRSIGNVIYAENCFVALFDKSSNLFRMKFFVDKFDEPPPPADLNGTRTQYVFRTEKPLFLDTERTKQLEREGAFRLVGTAPHFWLGIPMKTPNEVIGVLVVQSYDEEHAYSLKDLEFLNSVAGQIALAIERKMAEEALRLSEEKHRVLFESNPFPVYVYDTESLRFLVVNEATVSHYGYSKEEFLNGLTLQDLRPAEDHADLLERVSRVNRQRDTIAAPSRHKKKDGTLINVEITSHVLDLAGRQAEIVLVNDITERLLAEEQLKLFNQKLQQSNRELQDFAYVASHDLQEPLRKVQTFSDRLGSKYADRLDETGLDYLERMRSAASRMQILIQDLLSFSRVTTKAQPFTQVDLEQITREVLSDLEVKIEETGAVIETQNLPKVDADPLQMRQLIQNLVGNALKFRRSSVSPVIKISATNGQSDGHGPFYTITVEDNGIGFDEKYLDKIFTVFQRLHGRAEYEGSGIGLAVCRKIVERHHGGITAQSTTGQGSKFIFTLPCYQANAEVN
ncbi:MAG TPA: PAS domain S-box protein [Pyrinomonadaceae bacterium]|nr:PAS domain S-box protein [Pyrinomonadaceae bacterium]